MAVARRAIMVLEKLGLTVRVARIMTGQMPKRIAAKNPFRNYTPTKHDVFVATYVKSGTNWMMQIAHQLVNHGKAEFEHIHCVVPWPDTAIMGVMRKYAIPVEDTSVWEASPEQKRVIKTHFNWELLPYSQDARYIMVIRDPKDVFVSSYFFFLKNGAMGDTKVSVDSWLKLFLSDSFPMWGSWAVNAASYWAQRHRPNVRVVSFKAMKRDLPNTVRMLADFLEVRASEEEIQSVCEKSSFDYMKRIDEKFRMWQLIPWIQVGPMIRKGAHGGSSELLSAEQQQQIDEYCIAALKRLGCDLPYEEFCDVEPRMARAAQIRG
jgi:hypothetical protein